ncbi:MAG TPA: DUF3243 domain-containing protein [Clostridia bacterium]|nr:DUF3243 domain-containing protein [Clostridia bacterium]
MKIGNNVSWEDWKKRLGMAVRMAEGVGISEEKVDDLAFRIGNFLADKIDPANPEQMILHELWRAGTEEDRKVLARLIVNLVNDYKPDNSKQ